MDTEAGETVVLVQAAREGISGARDRLFVKFAPFVRHVIELYLGVGFRRPEDIDDYTQDALLRALKGFERFGKRPENNFRAWLACCARTAVLDARKIENRGVKKGKIEKSFTEWGSEYIASSILEGRTPTPSQVAIANETREKIVEVLSGMTERERRVIVCRKICRMPYDRIAEELGLKTEEYTRVFCHRALEKLHRKIVE
jgi:RNA polymerase sigma factor (sigma-70 family)